MPKNFLFPKSKCSSSRFVSGLLGGFQRCGFAAPNFSRGFSPPVVGGERSSYFKRRPPLRSQSELRGASTLCERAIRSKVVSHVALAEWDMYYVYILKSEKNWSRYIGVTEDLKRRLTEHNSGNARYSSAKKPFKIIWYCAFTIKTRAHEFEKYLKSSSGYAFTKKHLI